MDKICLGDFGERMAVALLEEQDYMILERNFTCRLGEIDIIAEKNGEIIFVEVKTRSSQAYGNPSEAVNKNKKIKIRKAATIYMLSNKLIDHKVRFDVVELVVNHMEGAF